MSANRFLDRLLAADPDNLVVTEYDARRFRDANGYRLCGSNRTARLRKKRLKEFRAWVLWSQGRSRTARAEAFFISALDRQPAPVRIPPHLRPGDHFHVAHFTRRDGSPCNTATEHIVGNQLPERCAHCGERFDESGIPEIALPQEKTP